MAGQSATWQDTSGAENLIRINREFGKSLEWLAERVGFEPTVGVERT